MPRKAPRLPGRVHVFRMTIVATFLAKLNLEDIEQSSLIAVGITALLDREAAGDFMAYEANPLLCDHADSCHTTMIMLVRVGETDDPVEAHGARRTSG